MIRLNGFILQAVAEKVAVLRARGLLGALSEDEQAAYLAARISRSRSSGLQEILAAAGTKKNVTPGDEIPSGWLDGSN